MRCAFHQLTYGPFCIKQIVWVRDIHILPRPIQVPASLGISQDFWVFLHHPCRHRISGRPDNHANPCLFHRINYPHHMGKVEYPILRLTSTPGRLCNPYHIYPCRLHHPHILLQPPIWQVFLIICRPIKQFVHCLPPSAPASLAPFLLL